MKTKQPRIEYASKTFIKSIGGITGCYPMGKGQGLFRTSLRKEAEAKAREAGWKFVQLADVGHDYNFDADIFKVYREV